MTREQIQKANEAALAKLDIKFKVAASIRLLLDNGVDAMRNALSADELDQFDVDEFEQEILDLVTDLVTGEEP